MSKQTEDKDQAFRDWKKELDDRCNEHLQKFPEHKPKKSTSLQKFALPNTIVQVLESSVDLGSWNVWMNGNLEKTFWGPLAQRDAASFANDLLNPPSREITPRGSLSLPNLCVFCGGRFYHRTDCPDSKKQGPEFPPQLPPHLLPGE